MAGSLIERSLSSAMNNMGSTMNGMGNQPAPQIDPRVIQAIISSQAPSMMMPQGYGASRFLTGDTNIPLNYGVDVPAYTPFSMTPGPFQDFMAAQRSSGGGFFNRNRPAVIPVFDPTTGTYMQTGRSNTGDGEVVGYNVDGSPVYLTAPNTGPFGTNFTAAAMGTDSGGG